MATLYVNSGSGNDSNDGSESSPKATILAAINAASSGDTIILHAGHYTTNSPTNSSLVGTSTDTIDVLTFLGAGDGLVWLDGTGNGDSTQCNHLVKTKMGTGGLWTFKGSTATEKLKFSGWATHCIKKNSSGNDENYIFQDCYFSSSIPNADIIQQNDVNVIRAYRCIFDGGSVSGSSNSNPGDGYVFTSAADFDMQITSSLFVNFGGRPIRNDFRSEAQDGIATPVILNCTFFNCGNHVNANEITGVPGITVNTLTAFNGGWATLGTGAAGPSGVSNKVGHKVYGNNGAHNSSSYNCSIGNYYDFYDLRASGDDRLKKHDNSYDSRDISDWGVDRYALLFQLYEANSSLNASRGTGGNDRAIYALGRQRQWLQGTSSLDTLKSGATGGDQETYNSNKLTVAAWVKLQEFPGSSSTANTSFWRSLPTNGTAADGSYPWYPTGSTGAGKAADDTYSSEYGGVEYLATDTDNFDPGTNGLFIIGGNTDYNADNSWGLVYEEDSSISYYYFYIHDGNDTMYTNEARFDWGVDSAWNTGDYDIRECMWIHIVGVYDGALGSDNVKLYVNGRLGNKASDYTSNVAVTDTRITIGAGSTNSYSPEQWPGRIAEVGIWSSSLGHDEVEALYADGVSHNYQYDSGSYSGSHALIGYWRLGGMISGSNHANEGWTFSSGSYSGGDTSGSWTLPFTVGGPMTTFAEPYSGNDITSWVSGSKVMGPHTGSWNTIFQGFQPVGIGNDRRHHMFNPDVHASGGGWDLSPWTASDDLGNRPDGRNPIYQRGTKTWGPFEDREISGGTIDYTDLWGNKWHPTKPDIGCISTYANPWSNLDDGTKSTNRGRFKISSDYIIGQANLLSQHRVSNDNIDDPGSGRATGTADLHQMPFRFTIRGPMNLRGGSDVPGTDDDAGPNMAPLAYTSSFGSTTTIGSPVGGRGAGDDGGEME